MQIARYLADVIAKYASGRATEHSYRPMLQSLFESIDPNLTIINEPKKSEAGMPDFLFERNGVPFGWVEAKDIDKDVIKLKGYSVEQRKRYEKAYPNLIYTNGVDFEFIREGESVHFVSIADFQDGLQPLPEKFEELERQLKLFAEQKPISIRSAARLAEIMAAKAAIIKDEIGIALADEVEARKGLEGQFKSFKANLLPNLKPDEFADIYAETITYGMFAARFHDTDLNTFSRQEAMDDLPASNPFLKALFEYIAGPALPKRLIYIVDDLVAVMRASDPHSLFEKYGQFTARNDPFIHFYEDFLAAYNPKKRKSRGVWYTPEPVVDFIVRAVDEALQNEFGLADGLADTSKVTVDWDTGTNHPKTGKAITIKKEVHQVQILDPATGTGTFLAKAVQLIGDRVKARAPGKWSGYVEQDLLPRLHGFELLMASYAMCHMKLDMQLAQTGYRPSANPPRLSVWLTNALEPAEREVMELWFTPLANEARGASLVKRQLPIMVVLANPPYTRSSANKGEWIINLLSAYKKGLDESAVNSLSQDEIKFIRLFEHIINQNGRGVAGFIVNNSFLDGVTHRIMRSHLINSFDKIYILNLRGDTNKGEPSPPGVSDKNVFDIRQGVAIVLFVKNNSAGPAKVYYKDLFGDRNLKYDTLFNESLSFINENISPDGPQYFLKDILSRDENYEKFFSVSDLFETSATGVKFRKDNLLIRGNFTVDDVRHMVADVKNLEPSALERKYNFSETSDWRVVDQRGNFDDTNVDKDIVQVCYRPFDLRYTYYPEDRISKIIPRGDSRKNLMVHHLRGPNLALLTGRQNKSNTLSHFFVTSEISEMKTAESSVQSTHFPLYRWPEGTTLDLETRLNLNPKLYTAICTAAGIDPADQSGSKDDFRAASGAARPSEIKVFDYMYGVLHAPGYRTAYAEFLKTDFPRIPYPTSPEMFDQLSTQGEALRRLHLMEGAAIGATPYPFEGEGDDVVAIGYPKFEDRKVWINADQYFANVPTIAWSFPIGGYQPAQKWLKDRRNRALSWDEIGHYQKIVKILVETDRIMGEIEL